MSKIKFIINESYFCDDNGRSQNCITIYIISQDLTWRNNSVFSASNGWSVITTDWPWISLNCRSIYLIRTNDSIRTSTTISVPINKSLFNTTKENIIKALKEWSM